MRVNPNPGGSFDSIEARIDDEYGAWTILAAGSVEATTSSNPHTPGSRVRLRGIGNDFAILENGIVRLTATIPGYTSPPKVGINPAFMSSKVGTPLPDFVSAYKAGLLCEEGGGAALGPRNIFTGKRAGIFDGSIFR